MPRGSKTEAPCDCGYLDKAARDPEIPIEFDARLNEFNFVKDNCTSRIYHCPWCGGMAPQSLRQTLFAHVTHEEQRRVLGLTQGCRDVDDVMQKLGPPSLDLPTGVVIGGSMCNGWAPCFQARQMLVYTGLSETSDLRVQEASDSRLSISLQAKYIGPPAK